MNILERMWEAIVQYMKENGEPQAILVGQFEFEDIINRWDHFAFNWQDGSRRFMGVEIIKVDELMYLRII
jgi:hypothetical protein